MSIYNQTTNKNFSIHLFDIKNEGMYFTFVCINDYKIVYLTIELIIGLLNRLWDY